MNPSDDGKKTEDVNWADYFDALLNEAWLEKHKPLLPAIGSAERAAKMRLEESGTDPRQ